MIMNKKAHSLEILAEVTHRHEADNLLRGEGTAVLVRRGLDRSLVMVCPDGCGDVLTINLDRRAGPAWRLYKNKNGVSLYPSVWRDAGCCSHFIIWQAKLIWCDADDHLLDEENQMLERDVLRHLSDVYTSYSDLAEALGEVPWPVLIACRRLVKKSFAQEGFLKQRGMFRKC